MHIRPNRGPQNAGPENAGQQRPYLSAIGSRPYWVVRSRLWYDVLSVCRLSVTFCIVSKRYVVEGRRWYRWIGRW